MNPALNVSQRTGGTSCKGYDRCPWQDSVAMRSGIDKTGQV
jgi:hypothetical protein